MHRSRWLAGLHCLPGWLLLPFDSHVLVATCRRQLSVCPAPERCSRTPMPTRAVYGDMAVDPLQRARGRQ